MNTDFKTVIQEYKISLHELFPTYTFSGIAIPDMGTGSQFFGKDPEHENLKIAKERLDKFQQLHPNSLLANGYLEERSFYNTNRFKRTINSKTEYRNIHLGTDFWMPAETAIHTPYDGKIVISHHNDFHKDYGPLLVVQHQLSDVIFYTLYGHLTIESLAFSPIGKKLKKGELLAHVGTEEENGHWLPHLHFQIITDLLNETENYNGVAFQSEIERWKQLCPDPDLIFTESLH